MKIKAIPMLLLFLINACNSDGYIVQGDIATKAKADSVTCSEYKINYPAATDGYYQLNLDLDESTPLQEAYCDFSGGWTTVFSLDSTVADLEALGDTTPISATFYSDPVKGIGWGEPVVTGGNNPIPTQLSCFKLSKVKGIKEIKATFTWDGAGGTSFGYLFMGNQIDISRYSAWGDFYPIHAEEGFANTINAWGNRNRLTMIKPAPTADVVVADWNGNSAGKFETAEGTYTSDGNLEICMGTESGYGYDRRFMTSLSFK